MTGGAGLGWVGEGRAACRPVIEAALAAVHGWPARPGRGAVC